MTNTNDNMLLKGCALVIDDEIDNKKSSIAKIINRLETRGNFFVKRENIPNKETWEELSSFSYIILDWDLKHSKTKSEVTLPPDVMLGQTLVTGETIVGEYSENIDFIKSIISNHFLPIFIFSDQDITNITNKLETDVGIKKALDKKQVAVYDKGKLKRPDQMRSYFSKWLKNNRSRKIFIDVDIAISKSKNSFFVEMDNCHVDWIGVAYNAIKKDNTNKSGVVNEENLNTEFNSMITTAIMSRYNNVDFKGLNITNKIKSKADSHKIYEAIKFYSYTTQQSTTVTYSGDIYQKYSNNQLCNEYVLNITAPCDVRDPYMLIVFGKGKDKYDSKNISGAYRIPLLLGRKSVEFRFDKYQRISTLAGDSFDFSQYATGYNELKLFGINYKRIGRLVSPYITILRQSFATFISREGFPRHPD